MSRAAAPSPPGWRVWLVALLAAVGLALVTSLSLRQAAPGLELDVRVVPLNPDDPGQTSVGPLRFRGGLWLRSPDPRFGGLSDLRVVGDGRRLLAVSDCGRGFVATLVYDAGGDLVGLEGARFVDLAGLRGRALEDAEIDAEALEVDERGGLVVGFEGRPRIWRYRSEPAFAGTPEPQPTPALAQACRGNRGLEALVGLGDGRLLLLCEGHGLRPESYPAWVGADETWAPRTYRVGASPGPGDVFRPTAAARLPDGDILVLERRYPPLGARLRRLSRADLEGSGTLSPRDVALLEPPLTLDNLEGVAVRRDASGDTLVYLLSDDNGCTKMPGVVSARVQRTLLLLFALGE